MPLFLLLLACADERQPTVREGRAESITDLPPPDAQPDPDTADTGDPPAQPEDSGEAEQEPPEEPPPEEPEEEGPVTACYPGEAEDWSACVPVVDYDAGWGDDYDYPAPYGGSAQYTAPARFVDLSAVDAGMQLAPNFTLDEFMQEWKGRYGVYQTHVVAELQAIRDSIGGPLIINSGYRNVSYNAGVGGATYSRHMYGDAADMASDYASLSELEDLCYSRGGGYIELYTTHIHCDWRDEGLDDAFYDVSSLMALSLADPPLSARLARSGGAWTAPAEGFEEGEPLRVWTAYDAAGSAIDLHEGPTYAPPAGAARIEVVVGGQVLVAASALP